LNTIKLPLIDAISGKLVICLKQAQKLNKLAENQGGLIKTSEMLDAGIKAYEIRKLVQDGVLERIKQGYYQLKENEEISEEALIAKLFPDGVICMNTALFYYGYSNRTPMAWDIAIDKHTSKSRFKLEYPYVQPYYLEPHLLTFGVTTGDFSGSLMKIFDRDRLICECLKYENKMDRETYNKAIQSYVVDAGKRITKLLEYAQKRRVLKQVKDRIGVWL
jgi:predicted transcriptional regulator of viral defense system